MSIFHDLPPELYDMFCEQFVHYNGLRTAYVLDQYTTQRCSYFIHRALKQIIQHAAQVDSHFFRYLRTFQEEPIQTASECLTVFFKIRQQADYLRGGKFIHAIPQLEEVQAMSQKIEDSALEAAWPKMAEAIAVANPDLEFNREMNAGAIRNWMQTQQPLLQNVTQLNFHRSDLVILPSEIKYFTGLRELGLNYNKLSTLPPEIGKLTHLESLHIEDNALTSLPVEIGQLTSLQNLCLNRNQLCVFPNAVTRLSSLRTLSIRATNSPIFQVASVGLRNFKLLF